ncbi:MAG TPA: carbamoyl-phosphate synthase large subunit [Tepidisphaeraceae bacterium]|jgi:carbamoyl-phosphate synthase large subunit
MPRRTDIHTILIIGSGPIVIGQGCEFDYSGVQACRAIKEEGYRVVLVNSNPATIMTDPEFADATYIEPITPEAVEKILENERRKGTPIDALLPTLGGQTGLNTGMACFDRGILQKYGVKMIGANREAIFRGEDRQRFKDLMLEIGLKVPRSGVVHTMDEARKVLDDIGLPLIIRPAFTLGGTGGGIAYNREEFETIVARGLDASPVTEVLIEQSVLGWKEYEMEVMRDRNDNVVIICSIENLDPMGVHTGDSITVAPIQTLTDKEYQRMRDASIAVIRAVGVETGGSNIQFAIDPDNGDMIVVEMNPRVSRSSALASKATGYPIAKLAAKLAVGYTLDELANDITSIRGKDGRKEATTSACFEPTIDYCVIKIPRWTFEKFPDADETLTTQMKSVGEAMAIGRTFKEALQKGIRSMEVKRFGFGLDRYDKWLNAQKSRSTGAPPVSSPSTNQETHGRGARATDDQSDKTTQGESADQEWPIPADKLRRKLAVPSQGRLYYLRYALKMGWTIEQIYELTKIDKWFLAQMKELVDFEERLFTFSKSYGRLGMNRTAGTGPEGWAAIFREAKALGYSDVQLANVLGNDPPTVRVMRASEALGSVRPVYKLVDTCAAEFEAYTPYYYSTYETPYKQLTTDNGQRTIVEDEIRLSDRPKVLIIGGGPNRIGQGIEFDYCCVQAAFAMKELGLESVMINSNPETVSTDYDTSDLLFFEPLTHEDVLNICERLNGGPFKTEAPHAHSGLSSKNLVKGVIVQFGGQTPLNLAKGLKDAGVPILGTTVESIDAAGDREQFRALLQRLNLRQPANGIARNPADAREIARQIGYPVLVRPSFVLGGRAMEIVSDEDQLNYYMTHAVEAVAGGGTGADQRMENPILIDKFLDNATEVDVDCLADYDPQGPTPSPGTPGEGRGEGSPRAIIIGVMEHIEEAGIHSGDSACALPPYSLSTDIVQRLKEQTRALAKALRVRGLMNVQYAIKDNQIYVIEVNPRASRTVPFVSKATGVPWAKIAAKVMAGKSLAELNVTEQPDPPHTSVKEVVFPFSKFPGVDVILGPEMRSTGEVMGIDANFPLAFAKSQVAAGGALPTKGRIYISVNNADKAHIVPIARELADCGFELIATEGTWRELDKNDVAATRIPKLAEGRPNIADYIKNAQVQLIINTPTRKGPATDEGRIRAMAVLHKVPMITTLTGARAAASAIKALQKGDWGVKPLQEYVRTSPAKAD